MKTFIVCTAIAFCFIINANAQKLPNKQETSLRAPTKLKIDGLATEWGDRLQAYNRSTQIFYAISNDDKNLYLIVQAKYEEIIRKIIRGGITLVINHTTNKKDPKPVTITYPIFNPAPMSGVANAIVGHFNTQPDTSYKPVPIKEINNRLDAGAKTLIITGVNALDSDTLSVYNTYGIKAAGQFDNKMLYNYELAIPLKYLEIPDNGSTSFIYQLKINAPSKNRGLEQVPPPENVVQLATTDFWGQYTLAK
jgi:hypothetical protein